jgi:hypothetical protein
MTIIDTKAKTGHDEFAEARQSKKVDVVYWYSQRLLIKKSVQMPLCTLVNFQPVISFRSEVGLWVPGDPVSSATKE